MRDSRPSFQRHATAPIGRFSHHQVHVFAGLLNWQAFDQAGQFLHGFFSLADSQICCCNGGGRIGVRDRFRRTSQVQESGFPRLDHADDVAGLRRLEAEFIPSGREGPDRFDLYDLITLQEESRWPKHVRMPRLGCSGRVHFLDKDRRPRIQFQCEKCDGLGVWGDRFRATQKTPSTMVDASVFIYP